MSPAIELLKVKTVIAISNNQIKEKEAISLIQNEFPIIEPSHIQTADIYQFVKRFADLTRRFAQINNLGEVKHCFNVAEKMIKEGNCVVRMAIENVYIFSIAHLLDVSPRGFKIKGIMNESLRNEYLKQINTSGI